MSDFIRKGFFWIYPFIDVDQTFHFESKQFATKNF